MALREVPTHIAIIPDGNRRWARRHYLPTFWGHRRGILSAAQIVRSALEQNIPYLTFFAFSTENWQRSQIEITYLMSLFLRTIHHYRTRLLKQQICVRFIGDLQPIPENLRTCLLDLQERSQAFSNLTLTIAINYGSRNELLRAIHQLSGDEKKSCTWEQFCQHLDTKELPEVDLVIRTSGEQRLSNFLLLQSAYAEIVFTKVLWPDFSEKNFVEALAVYRQRKRNFGR